MKQIPLCSSKKIISTLKRNGFVRGRVKKGSHQSFVRYLPSGRKITVTVIEGKREVPRKTLGGILKRAQKTVEHFQKLLR